MVIRQALRAFSDPLVRIVVLPAHRVVYVKNAKVATSTTVLWLHRIYTGDARWAPDLNVHRAHQVPTGARLGWPAALEAINDAAVRFSFVRHPVRRLESAYVDKIANPAKRVPGTPALAMV